MSLMSDIFGGGCDLIKHSTTGIEWPMVHTTTTQPALSRRDLMALEFIKRGHSVKEAAKMARELCVELGAEDAE